VRIVLMVDWLATFPDHASQLFTWSDLQQRIIGGYRLSGWQEADIREALGQK
jgi:hypothetical protein